MHTLKGKNNVLIQKLLKYVIPAALRIEYV